MEPIFAWASHRMTWATLPLILWMAAWILTRFTRRVMGRRKREHPAWRWTFVAAIAWLVIAIAIHMMWPPAPVDSP